MNENISALRVDLYCCEEQPAKILQPFIPNNYKYRSWIPQTMGDQIWVMYEFHNELDRLEWEKTLPENIEKWLDRELIESALEFGWHIRDQNGFYDE